MEQYLQVKLPNVSLFIGKWRESFICWKLSINIFHHGCVSGWTDLCFRKNVIAASENQTEGKTLFWQFFRFPTTDPLKTSISTFQCTDFGSTFSSSQKKSHSNPPPKSNVCMHSTVVHSTWQYSLHIYLCWASCRWRLNEVHSSPFLPLYRCLFLLLWTAAPELRWRTLNPTSAQQRDYSYTDWKGREGPNLNT